MKSLTLPLAALLAAVCVSPVGAQTGDLKLKVVYKGAAPVRKKVDVNKDVEFCGPKAPLVEDLIVNKENGGVQNVVVHVYTGRGGSKLDGIKAANNTVTLANMDCRFEPHVVVMQAGDTLRVTNPDQVGHNANLAVFANDPQNFTIPAGGEKSVLLEKAEPALCSVICNIHPWMKANLLVLDHPFAAVSDENGDVLIKGLPVGEKLVFRIIHETGSFRNVAIGDQKISRRGTFEVTIKQGENDLGKVVME